MIIDCKCSWCGKQFKRDTAQTRIHPSGQTYCSKSCSASVVNLVRKRKNKIATRAGQVGKVGSNHVFDAGNGA